LNFSEICLLPGALTPAKAGIQSFQDTLDHGFRRGDIKGQIFKALAGLTDEPTGEAPYSGARRRDKAERSESRDSRRRSRREQLAESRGRAAWRKMVK
jgi:hypothetical protein